MAWLLLRGPADDPNSLLSLNVDYFLLLKYQYLEEIIIIIHLYLFNQFISLIYLFFLSDRCSFQGQECVRV